MAEQSFWDMLRTKRDSLTKSGIIVADYLMQHAEDAQYLSISSLAKACGVAEATIFRFCRALGFDGYNEMKIALAKATATAMPVSLKLEPGVDTQTLCTHAYNTAIEALNGTRSALDPESVDRAATLLQRARQVFFFGQGGSYILACDIWARFSMLSTKFRTAGDSHMQAIAASLMGPEDVVVFVSYSGATRDMMDSLHLARENGAKVILLTHYSDAPGAALADVVLLCGAKESPLDSGSMPVKLAVLFVANVLVLRYTLDNQELANLSLSRTSRALGSKLLSNKHKAAREHCRSRAAFYCCTCNVRCSSIFKFSGRPLCIPHSAVKHSPIRPPTTAEKIAVQQYSRLTAGSISPAACRRMSSVRTMSRSSSAQAGTDSHFPGVPSAWAIIL